MPRLVTSGLIQCSLPLQGAEGSVEEIKEKMFEKHIPMIKEAGNKGVQILCMQEVFTTPYFCPSQDVKWYQTAERIPDGPTIKRLMQYAEDYEMVIIAPIYEEAMTGVYYNTAAVIDADGKYLGKYRKNHIPHVAGFWEKFFFKPGNLGYPVFKTRYADIGVYICYDRHFPEGARLLSLHGAEIIYNPSATVTGLSQHLWKIEQPAHAISNGIFMGCINRVGREQPWDIGTFYGTSYFVNPKGTIITEASQDHDELLLAELDLHMIREVRDTWQFFRDRRPETYNEITELIP
jgi:N-carbamoylputrescine amidase